MDENKNIGESIICKNDGLPKKQYAVWFILLFALFFVLGTGQKLYYGYRLSGYLDGDWAVAGLTADDILHGKFKPFAHGCDYNGVLDAYLMVPFIYIWGLRVYACMAGMTALYAILLLLIFKLGTLIKNKYVGLWAMAYFALPPHPLIFNSVFSVGHRLSTMVFGVGVLILVLLLDKNENDVTGHNIWKWGLLGVIAGVGFWNHFMILYYLVPAALFLCMRRDFFKKIGYYIFSLFCFFIGGLPFWIHNAQNNFMSFNIAESPSWPYRAIENPNVPPVVLLKRFVEYHLSGVLGIQSFNVAAYILYGIVIGAGIIFCLRMRMNRKKFLLILFLVSFLGFSLTQKFFIMEHKHSYFIAVYPVIAIWFAYLIDWLYGKSKIAAMGLLAFILIFNVSDFTLSKVEGRHGKEDVNQYNYKCAFYKSLLEFIKLNKIDGIAADFDIAQGVNFLTDRKTIGAEFMNGLPITDSDLQSKDHIAILDCAEFLRPTLNILCRTYKFAHIDSRDILYGFNKFAYLGKSIPSADWSAKSNYNSEKGMYGFDRNLDKSWSLEKNGNFKPFYELDLGRSHKIYKLVFFNLAARVSDFPSIYKIRVSNDGALWNTVKIGKIPQPFFWSGPRIYWDYYNGRIEINFNPVKARYIKIEGFCHDKNTWAINELFVYEYKGKKECKVRDYAKQAKKVYDFLRNNGIQFVYADFWLSAKIMNWSGGEIDTLRVLNELYPKREHTSRLMELNKDTAVVVNKGEEEEVERVLKYFDLPVQKQYIGGYVCYLFRNLSDWQEYFLKNQKCLYWMGISVGGINYHVYSHVLTNYGVQVEKTGDVERAIHYFKKAADIFPRNNIAHEKLARAYKSQKLLKESKKELLKLRHFCYPKVAKKIEFKNGITFLGYTLFQYEDKLYTNYYWHIPENIPKNIGVFVHFNRSDKIIFQGDHEFLFHYPKPIVPVQGHIFVETGYVKLSDTIAPGVYEIVFGLVDVHTGKRIKSKKGSLTKFEIGTVKINPAPSNGN